MILLLALTLAAYQTPIDRALSQAELRDKLIELLNKTFEDGFECGARGISHDTCMKFNALTLEKALGK